MRLSTLVGAGTDVIEDFICWLYITTDVKSPFLIGYSLQPM